MTSVFTVDCHQCHAVVQKSDLKNHLENNCTKRTVSCPNSSNGCDWRGLFENLASHKSSCNFSETSQPTKKRKRAEKGTSARAQKMMTEFSKNKQNATVLDPGLFDPNVPSWDPKASDKSVQYTSNHLATRGQSASGIVIANFSIQTAEQRYWEITYEQETSPKLFGPYFGFVVQPADICESMYKHHYCYSCTGTVFVKGQQTMIKKQVAKGDTIGFFISKQSCTVFINRVSQGVVFEHLPPEVIPAVQPNSSLVTANFNASGPFT